MGQWWWLIWQYMIIIHWNWGIAYFQTNWQIFSTSCKLFFICTYLFDMPWLLCILCALLGYWSKFQTQRNEKKPWSISDSQPITRDIQSAGYPLRSHEPGWAIYIYRYDHHWSSTFNPKRKLRAYLLDVFSKFLKPPFEFGDGVQSLGTRTYQCHQAWHWNNLHLPGLVICYSLRTGKIHHF